jgi:hypothetical protein
MDCQAEGPLVVMQHGALRAWRRWTASLCADRLGWLCRVGKQTLREQSRSVVLNCDGIIYRMSDLDLTLGAIHVYMPLTSTSPDTKIPKRTVSC